MKVALLVILAVILSTPAYAQKFVNGQWQEKNAPLANNLSTIGAYSAIGLDVLHDLRSDRQMAALSCSGIKLAMAAGVPMLLKHFVSKERPDASDNKSFPSQHTAIAASMTRWNMQIAVPLSVFVGYARVAARKHDWIDVGTGAAIGSVAAALCQ